MKKENSVQFGAPSSSHKLFCLHATNENSFKVMDACEPETMIINRYASDNDDENASDDDALNNNDLGSSPLQHSSDADGTKCRSSAVRSTKADNDFVNNGRSDYSSP